MKQKLNSFYLFFSLMTITSLALASCNDFIEEDISGNTPVLILPHAGDTISEFSNFIWEEMKGANKYRLEIYSPSFSAPNFIAIDTVLSANDVFLSLTPNQYQLRLRGLNNGYESLPTEAIDFWVDTISSNQLHIDLLSPLSTTYYPSNFNGQFTWSSLPNVSTYEMSLRTGTNYQTGTIVYTQNNITSTSHTVTGVTFNEGEYVWGVKANMNQGNSTIVFTNTFKIDGTVPGIPVQQNPVNFAIVTSPVSFTWTNPQDVGQIQSPITTHLEVASDTSFSSIVETASTQNNTEDITINQPGNYYWRLYNVDEAGNQSGYSSVREFTIN